MADAKVIPKVTAPAAPAHKDSSSNKDSKSKHGTKNGGTGSGEENKDKDKKDKNSKKGGGDSKGGSKDGGGKKSSKKWLHIIAYWYSINKYNFFSHVKFVSTCILVLTLLSIWATNS